MSEVELQSALERIESHLAKLARESRRPAREALSLRDAAAVLGVDRTRTLPALIAAGSIRVVDIGGHQRIARAELDRVLREGAPLTPVPARSRRPRQPRRSIEEEAAAILALKVRCR